jgi:hypothetical protein
LTFVLIESSKGFVSAFFTYGLNKDVCYVSDMHCYLREFELAGVKVIPYKTFFFYMLKGGLKCDNVVLTEKIFNIKSWFVCFLLRAGEIEYLDNLAVQDCTWQDSGFLGFFSYINSGRLALLQATGRVSLRYLLWLFKFLLSYPFLFIVGFRVIVLNNGVAGYRMPLLADKSLYWDGSIKNLPNLSLSGIVVLMPLVSEPKANVFYNAVVDLIKRLRSFAETSRTQVYLKPHPRSDDSFFSYFDGLAGNFELVSKAMPLEMYDLKKAILLTHRSTTDIEDCLAFFCFGEFLGLSKKELIGVRASMTSSEEFLGFIRLSVGKLS